MARSSWVKGVGGLRLGGEGLFDDVATQVEELRRVLRVVGEGGGGEEGEDGADGGAATGYRHLGRLAHQDAHRLGAMSPRLVVARHQQQEGEEGGEGGVGQDLGHERGPTADAPGEQQQSGVNHLTAGRHETVRGGGRGGGVLEVADVMDVAGRPCHPSPSVLPPPPLLPPPCLPCPPLHPPPSA